MKIEGGYLFVNYEFWIAAEKFLHDSFFVNLLLLGLLLFFILNRLTFIGDNNSKASNIIFSIVIILFITFGIITTTKYNKYKVLYDYDRYVNYGIRNYERTIFTFNYPSRMEKTLYNRLYLVNNFRKTTIYKEEKIIENVEYIGKDGDNYYFQDKDQIIYRELGDHLEIVDDISTPIREGVKFHLNDPRFKDIGFKENSPHPYLLSYKIPKSQSNKSFENPNNLKVLQEGEFRLGWINPAPSNNFSFYEENK